MKKKKKKRGTTQARRKIKQELTDLTTQKSHGVVYLNDGNLFSEHNPSKMGKKKSLELGFAIYFKEW